MQKYQCKGKLVHYMDSFEEFLKNTDPAFLAKLVGKPDYRPKNHDVFLYEEDDARARATHIKWAGGLTYHEAHEQAKAGINLTADLLDAKEKVLKHLRPAPIEESYMDVAGGSQIDIGTYLSGQPECVMAYREASGRSRRTVALVYNGSVSCNVSPLTLMLRGIAFLSLVDALEASNLYRVAVYYAEPSYHFMPLIRLKDYGDTYDPQALGFAIGHPAMLRQLIFGYYDTLGLTLCEKLDILHSDGRGRPAGVRDLPKELAIGARMGSPEEKETKHVWECPQMGYFNTLDQASEWVLEELTKYGVEVQLH